MVEKLETVVEPIENPTAAGPKSNVFSVIEIISPISPTITRKAVREEETNKERSERVCWRKREEREREGQTDRQGDTDRDRQTDRRTKM